MPTPEEVEETKSSTGYDGDIGTSPERVQIRVTTQFQKSATVSHDSTVRYLAVEFSWISRPLVN